MWGVEWWWWCGENDGGGAVVGMAVGGVWAARVLVKERECSEDEDDTLGF